MKYESVRSIFKLKRALEILDFIGEKSPINFSDIEKNIETSTDTIQLTLERLHGYNLIERKQISQKNVKYSITNKGEKFLKKAEEINAFLNNKKPK